MEYLVVTRRQLQQGYVVLVGGDSMWNPNAPLPVIEHREFHLARDNGDGTFVVYKDDRETDRSRDPNARRKG